MGVDFFFCQWQGVESSDIMQSLCLSVNPHCVTEVHRLDIKCVTAVCHQSTVCTQLTYFVLKSIQRSC